MSSHGLAQHEAARLAAEMERQAKREKMSLGRRLDLALFIAARQSYVSAKELGDVILSGAPQGSPPTGGLDPDVQARRDRAEALVRELEGVVDRFARRPVAADRVNEHEEDRDRRLVADFEGLTPEEVWRVDPSFAPTGDLRAIERARVRMDRDPYLGGAADK